VFRKERNKKHENKMMEKRRKRIRFIGGSKEPKMIQCLTLSVKAEKKRIRKIRIRFISGSEEPK